MSFRHISATGAFRSSSRFSLLRMLALSLASSAFVLAIACGSDNAANKPGATVDGETLRWSPPWEAGDTRTVTISSSYEFSPEFQAMFDEYAALLQDPEYGGGIEGYEDIFSGQESQQASGTIRFIDADSEGAVVEYEIDLEQMVEAMMEEMDTAEIPEEEMEQFTAIINLLSQLGFSLQFEIAPNGELTGVANLQETADSLRGFIDSMMTLAGTEDESAELFDEETEAMIDKLFAELPETELAKQLALFGANSVTGNMFLMRQGEYTVGEPVAVEGTVPSSFGLPVPGVATYSLTSVSDTQATIDVQITAQPVDVEAMVTAYATELADIFGEDVDVAEITAAFAEMTAEDRQMMDALVSMFFQPYTVTLTIDTVTGWVTGAEWEAEFSIPDELVSDFEDAPEDLEDFGITLGFRSTVE